MTPEQAARLASFPEQNPNPILEIDPTNKQIVYKNPALKKYFPELGDDGSQHPLLSQVLPRIAHRKDFQCEVLVNEWHFEQKVFFLPDSNLVRIYSSDVSTQKQIEKNLARLASFPEQNPNPIIEIDKSKSITYFNPAVLLRFPDFYAAKFEHVILKPIVHLLDDFFSGKRDEHQEEIIHRGSYYNMKLKYLPEGDVIRIFYFDITEQKKTEEIIREKNKDITDSINYAHRIQSAILPSLKDFQVDFPDSFICFHPKDIVSGDFYFHLRMKGVAIFAAADCTGHGVPGAMMSMVGSNLITQTVYDRNVASPATALSELDELMRRQLRQEDGGIAANDGMDIAMCAYMPESRLVQFSGANRPLILIRNGEIKEFEPDKYHIGGPKTVKKFTHHEFAAEQGDCLYIFTDGVHDQFGGEKGKKMMKKNFIRSLFESHRLPMQEQQLILEKKFMDWKGDLEQVDDVLVIGIRL